MSGGKFTISVHAGGELMPAFGVVDGVQQGTVEMAHTAPYYFFGKNEAFALDCAIPFGLNSRQLTAWMYDGNGMKLMREFYDQYNIVNFPGGNTGAQMGGWYRKEIKSAEGHQGSEDAHRRFRRQGADQDGRRAAKHPWWRDLPGAGKRHHRRHRMGRPLRRRKAGLPKGAPSTTTTQAGGKAAHSSTSTSTRRLSTACPRSTRPWSRRLLLMPTSKCRPVTTPATQPLSSAWSLAAPSWLRSPRR